MKTAIITGVTGQDGSYLAKLLLINGYRVIGITRDINSSNYKNLEYLKIENKIIFKACDLLDISSIIKLINNFKPDEIYNLAAQSSVSLSFEQPIGTIHYNILSVINLLESIRITKPNIKFYQAASSEMYGKVNKLPIHIETSMHPLSPYAISKASAYWIVQNYRESYSLFACNGVLFNHESHLRTNNFFVKKVINETIINRNNPNWTLRVGNIDIKRDFGFSPNYVEAMWLMLQTNKAKDYLICSGVSITLRSIIEYVFTRLNISADKLVVDIKLYRPTDIEDIYGDNSLAKNDLGWIYDKNFFNIIDILIEEELKQHNLDLTLF